MSLTNDPLLNEILGAKNPVDKLLEILGNTKPTAWHTKIPSGVLARLPQECHEAILSMLPQIGAIKDRGSGDLTVRDFGFSAKVGGVDERCPYPIDFCVRSNGGVEAGINLLVGPSTAWEERVRSLSKDLLIQGADAIDLIKFLVNAGVPAQELDLFMLQTYRQASPGSYQWGTAGGTFEIGESAESVAKRETREEFEGFKYIAWSPLVTRQLYQSSNMAELQSIGVVFGILNRNTAKTATDEGISGWMSTPLLSALEFLDTITEKSWQSAQIWTDGKIHHGLLALLRKLQL